MSSARCKVTKAVLFIRRTRHGRPCAADRPDPDTYVKAMFFALRSHGGLAGDLAGRANVMRERDLVIGILQERADEIRRLRVKARTLLEVLE